MVLLMVWPLGDAAQPPQLLGDLQASSSTEQFPSISSIGKAMKHGVDDAKAAAIKAATDAKAAADAQAATIKAAAVKAAADAKAAAVKAAADAKATAVKAAADAKAAAVKAADETSVVAKQAKDGAEHVAKAAEVATVKVADAVSDEANILADKTKALIQTMSSCGTAFSGSNSGEGSELGHTLAGWMGDPAVAALKLTELTLPGTHDSGAYRLFAEKAQHMPSDITKYESLARSFGVDAKPFEAIVVREWSVAQTQTVYKQLLGGIRYIDVRACFIASKEHPSGVWTVHHGVAPGYSVQTILSDVKKFLDENPSEVVLTELSHFSGCSAAAATTQQVASLSALVGSVLGTELIESAAALTSTIGQLVARKTRALVTMPGAGDVFENDYANTADLQKMEAHNVELVAKLKNRGASPNKLTKLSWTLTPDEATISKGVSSCVQGQTATHSLLQLADTAGAAFVNWFNKLSLVRNAAQMPLVANVILFDNPTHQQIATVLGKQ